MGLCDLELPRDNIHQDIPSAFSHIVSLCSMKCIGSGAVAGAGAGISVSVYVGAGGEDTTGSIGCGSVETTKAESCPRQ